MVSLLLLVWDICNTGQPGTGTKDVTKLRKLNAELSVKSVTEVADNSKLKGEFRMSLDIVVIYSIFVIVVTSNARQTLSLFAKHQFDLQRCLVSGLRHEEEVEDVGGEGDGSEQPECAWW